MKGWRFDPVALRMLRQEAQLTPAEMAAAVNCHLHSYHKYENTRRPQQPSTRMAWGIVNALSEALGRKVQLADIAEPTELPTLRQRAS